MADLTSDYSESPVKHTEAGRIPDTSKVKEYGRRVLSGANALGGSYRGIILGSLGLIGLGFGIYFLQKRGYFENIDLDRLKLDRFKKNAA